MPGQISLAAVRYGPNPYFPETGGHVKFAFNLNFDGAAPSSVNYKVALKDRDGNTVRMLEGVLGKPEPIDNTVKIFWDGKDEVGQVVALNGAYAPTFSAEAEGYSSVSQDYCSGVQVAVTGGGGGGGGPCD